MARSTIANNSVVNSTAASAASNDTLSAELLHRLLQLNVSGMTDRVAAAGGALYVAGRVNSLLISGSSSVSGNNATFGQGGAVCTELWLGNLTLTGVSSADGNHAGGDGDFDGLGGFLASDTAYRYVSAGTSITVSGGSSLSRNSAWHAGAAIALWMRSILITENSRVDGNTAVDVGGAFTSYFTDSWRVTEPADRSWDSVVITNYSSMSYNHAGVGGAVRVTDWLTLKLFLIDNNSHVDFNSASTTPGALRAYQLDLLRVTGNSSMSHNRGLTAAVTDGALAYSSNAADLGGGAVYASRLDLLLIEGGGSVCNNSLAGSGGEGGAVYVSGAAKRVVVRGTGSKADNNAAPVNGGFLSAYSLLELELSDGGSMTGNSASAGNGGAIMLHTSLANATVQSAGILANNSAEEGGAIYVTGSVTGSVVLRSGGIVEANRASRRTGGFLYVGSVVLGEVLVEGAGSRLCGCSSILSGGAISVQDAVYGGLRVADRGTACGNWAELGDGGLMYGGFTVTSVEVLTGASIEGNTADGRGGAVAMEGPLLQVHVSSGGRIANNQAGTDGGAFYADFISSLDLTNGATAAANVAGGDGGFAYTPRMGSLRIISSSVLANRAGRSGGMVALPSPLGSLEIWASNLSSNVAERGSGGVLYGMSRLGSSVPISASSRGVYNISGGTIMYGNSANLDGGAFFLSAEMLSSASALGLNITTARLISFTDVTFAANTANGAGGAISITSPSDRTRLVIRNATFVANIARTIGGALSARADAALRSDGDTGELAEGDGGSEDGGGASSQRRLLQEPASAAAVTAPPSVSPGPPSSAPAEGLEGYGASGPSGDTWLDIRDSTFQANVAVLDCGGGLYAEITPGGGTRISGCTFDGNRADGLSGGGMCIVARGNGAAVVLSGGTRVVRNSAQMGGGGVFAGLSSGHGHVLRAEDVILVDNKADVGGGLMLMAGPGSRAELDGVLLGANVAATSGGAVYAECAASVSSDGAMQEGRDALTSDEAAEAIRACGTETILSARGSNFTGNTAGTGRGGGIFLGTGSSATVGGCRLERNTAGAAGGSIAAVSCRSLELVGGSLVLDSAAFVGGGLFTQSCDRVLMRNVTLEGNHAVTDVLTFLVTVRVEPVGPPGPSLNASGNGNGLSASSPQRPWQDPGLAFLDPGSAAGGSLTVPVIGGIATWPYLTVRGWPGHYTLVFNASAVEDPGLYEDDRPSIWDFNRSDYSSRFKAVLGTDGRVAVVAIAPTDDPGSTSAASSSDSALATEGLEDVRSSWLALCQQLGYLAQANRLPGNSTGSGDGSSSVSSRTSITSVEELLAACGSLWVDASGGGQSGYQELQCNQGYTGLLCAACRAGFFINSDFECSPCPSQQRNTALALLALFGGVALVLYTSVTNLKENYAVTSDGTSQVDEEEPPSEFLKVAIVHVQFYIIIARLPVAYPDIITRMQAVMGAMTGAESSVAFSYSCFFRDGESDSQARAQLMGSLLVPCAVVAICIILWTLRYLLYNRARMRRASNLRGLRGKNKEQLHDVISEVLAASEAKQQQMPLPVPRASRLASADMAACDRGLSASDVSTQLDVERPAFRLSAVAPIGPAPLDDCFPTEAEPGSVEKAPPTALRKCMNALAALPQRLVERFHASALTKILIRLDETLGLRQQLGIMLMIAIFILYPGWAQASLSVFACYHIDDGVTGPFPQKQKATWAYGYWIRDMSQQCYSGVHLWFYVPVGVAAVLLFSLMPPALSFVLLWRNRHELDDVGTVQRYGFLYSRYK
ncbi:hypothetical protein GPECTOR_134g619 [Gonium pectorale]|uniref:Right handed beta helix domain-containing protein n=1 Tax=Gonium pectorale TaxID=33097 RepID=A0A150FZD0_GONPE|nr:hypothetical protein GPECTOR_134g619 [Gonium pectorale]|eukprot:KXZ42565.1 hypothetical protein GPECTOR_134g619 [Gonium pectorale]